MISDGLTDDARDLTVLTMLPDELSLVLFSSDDAQVLLEDFAFV